MCDYLSFCGDLEGNEFWFDLSLMSHSATAERHKLKPDTYREYEWVGPDADSLIVRTHPDDKRDAAYLRACVLAKWPDRKSLEDWLLANVEGVRIAQRLAKGGDSCTLTGGDGSTLTGGDRSTLTGGYGSTLTGGYGSTLTGGYGSTLTGGSRSTLTGGNRSTLTGGDGSTLTGGNRSTLTGGDGSTLTGGDGSTLTGGDRSTLTGGYESIVSFWFYDVNKYIRVVGIIGKDGLEPNVSYTVVDGKIVASLKQELTGAAGA